MQLIFEIIKEQRSQVQASFDAKWNDTLYKRGSTTKCIWTKISDPHIFSCSVIKTISYMKSFKNFYHAVWKWFSGDLV